MRPPNRQTWLHSASTCAKLSWSSIRSPSCPSGFSLWRGSVLPFVPFNGSPERLSLSGSHGQRPWVYNALKGKSSTSVIGRLIEDRGSKRGDLYPLRLYSVSSSAVQTQNSGDKEVTNWRHVSALSPLLRTRRISSRYCVSGRESARLEPRDLPSGLPRRSTSMPASKHPFPNAEALDGTNRFGSRRTDGASRARLRLAGCQDMGAAAIVAPGASWPPISTPHSSIAPSQPSRTGRAPTTHQSRTGSIFHAGAWILSRQAKGWSLHSLPPKAANQVPRDSGRGPDRARMDPGQNPDGSRTYADQYPNIYRMHAGQNDAISRCPRFAIGDGYRCRQTDELECRVGGVSLESGCPRFLRCEVLPRSSLSYA